MSFTLAALVAFMKYIPGGSYIPPVSGNYVAEDGVTFYVAENGTDFYVTET